MKVDLDRFGPWFRFWAEDGWYGLWLAGFAVFSLQRLVKHRLLYSERQNPTGYRIGDWYLKGPRRLRGYWGRAS